VASEQRADALCTAPWRLGEGEGEGPCMRAATTLMVRTAPLRLAEGPCMRMAP
jgi:hypothetical protein